MALSDHFFFFYILASFPWQIANRISQANILSKEQDFDKAIPQ